MLAYLAAGLQLEFLLVLVVATHGIFVVAVQGRDDVSSPRTVDNILGGSDRKLREEEDVVADVGEAIAKIINTARGLKMPSFKYDEKMLDMAATLKYEPEVESGEAIQFVEGKKGVIMQKYVPDENPTPQNMPAIASVIKGWTKGTGPNGKKLMGQIYMEGANSFACVELGEAAGPGAKSRRVEQVGGRTPDNKYLACVFDKAYDPGESAATSFSASVPRASVTMLVAAVAAVVFLA